MQITMIIVIPMIVRKVNQDLKNFFFPADVFSLQCTAEKKIKINKKCKRNRWFITEKMKNLCCYRGNSSIIKYEEKTRFRF